MANTSFNKSSIESGSFMFYEDYIKDDISFNKGSVDNGSNMFYEVNIKEHISAMYTDGCTGGKYFLGILVIIGVLGNILSIVVFHKGPTCSKSACSTYFKALAIADMYVLLCPCMELGLMCVSWKLAYRHSSTAACKLAIFGLAFPVEVSTWITVAVTFDRMLSVCFPFKFRNNNKPSLIYIKLILIVTFFALINAPQVISAKIDFGFCSHSFNGVVIFYNTVVESVFIVFLPLIINGVCNMLMVRKLYERAAFYRATRGSIDKLTSARNNEAQNITYRVMAICIIHALTTGPFVLTLFVLYWGVSYETAQENNIMLKVVTILNFIFYMNSGVNVFLYCVTGRDFRRDLKHMLSLHTCRSNVSTIAIE